MSRSAVSRPARATLRDHASAGLRDLLISGRLAPGDKLSVRDLAASLDVSPMPVREAVHRLVAERALEVRPQSAVRVPLMSRARFVELKTIRVNLEGMAAASAALRVTARELAGIQRHHERFRELARRARPDPGAVIRANQQLHFAVYRSAHMPTLLRLIESLWLQIGPVLNLDLRTSPRRLHAMGGNDSHARLVAALSRRDAAAARRALIRDIEDAAAYILSLDRLPDTKET